MEVTQEAPEEFDISRFLRNDPEKKPNNLCFIYSKQNNDFNSVIQSVCSSWDMLNDSSC